MLGIGRHSLKLAAFSLAVAAGALVAMAAVAGFADVGRVLANLDPPWVAVIAGGQVAAYIGYIGAYRATAAMREGPDISVSLTAKLVAVGFGAFALGGGVNIDRRALQGIGHSARDATVRVLGLSAIEYAVLAPAAWVCALLIADRPHVNLVLVLPWAIGVPVGFGLALWAAKPHWIARLGPQGRLRGALWHGLEGIGMLREVLGAPWRFRGVWLGIGLYWAGEIVSFWAGIRVVGGHVAGAEVILAYATGYAATRRSLPLAGAGVTEVLMPLALMWVGTPLALGVATVLAYRCFNLLLTVPPALLARHEVDVMIRGAHPDHPVQAS